MTNIDFSILKRNISMLMEKEGMTQEQLAGLLGMSQSGVSKCLKEGDDSRRFTLEQVCAVSQHFGVSIDELVGIGSADRKMSSREICSFLVTLIEQHVLKADSLTKEEHIFYEPYSIYSGRTDEIKDVTYDAFYFPGYWLPDDDDPAVGPQDWAEIQAVGNDIPQNTEINDFLQKFISAFRKYDTGVYSEDDYKILKEAYFNLLKK